MGARERGRDRVHRTDFLFFIKLFRPIISVMGAILDNATAHEGHVRGQTHGYELCRNPHPMCVVHYFGKCSILSESTTTIDRVQMLYHSRYRIPIMHQAVWRWWMTYIVSRLCGFGHIQVPPSGRTGTDLHTSSTETHTHCIRTLKCRVFAVQRTFCYSHYNNWNIYRLINHHS